MTRSSWVVLALVVGLFVARCFLQPKPGPMGLEDELAVCVSYEPPAAPLGYEAQDRLGLALLSVAFSPDGKSIASAGYAAGPGLGLRLWDAATGAFRVLLPSSVTAAAFSPDGKSIAYATANTPYIFELASGKSRPLRNAAGSGGLLSISYSPDGKWLAAGYVDGSIYAFKLATGEPKYLGSSDNGDTDVVAFSPKGRFVASGGDDATVRLWDMEGKASRVLGAHEGDEIFGLAFSRDGRFLASAASDDAASPCLFEVATGKRRCFGGSRRRATVYSAAFSPDGAAFAVSRADGSVTLYQVKDGSARDLTNVPEALYSVAFSPNGKLLATGGTAGAVRIWEVKTGKEILSAPSDL
jgi:WD40 repeat protein